MALFLFSEGVETVRETVDINALAVEATEALVETVSTLYDFKEADALCTISESSENGGPSMAQRIKALILKVWAGIKNIARKLYRYIDGIVRTLAADGSYVEINSGMTNFHKKLPSILEAALHILEKPYNTTSQLNDDITDVKSDYKKLVDGLDGFFQMNTKVRISDIENYLKFIKRTTETIEKSESKLSKEADSLNKEDSEEIRIKREILLAKINLASYVTQIAVKTSQSLGKVDFSLQPKNKEN